MSTSETDVACDTRYRAWAQDPSDPELYRSVIEVVRLTHQSAFHKKGTGRISVTQLQATATRESYLSGYSPSVQARFHQFLLTPSMDDAIPETPGPPCI